MGNTKNQTQKAIISNKKKWKRIKVIESQKSRNKSTRYLNNASSPLTMKEYTEPSLYVKSNHSPIDVVPNVQNILPLTTNKRCSMIIFHPALPVKIVNFPNAKMNY